MKLSIDRLREVMAYDHESGLFTWLITRGKARIGKQAGCPDHRGYMVCGIDGVRYYMHRLAMMHVTGYAPTAFVDHINGCRGDNRISNLRDVPHSINRQNQRVASRNSKSGVLGVRKFGNAYRATICVNSLPVHLGTFATPDEAQAAYLRSKRDLHPGCTI